MARPIKYDEEYVTNEANAFLRYVLDHEDCVTLAEFLGQQGDYDRRRWFEWVEEFGDRPEFSHPVKRANEIMEARIVNRALLGGYNATFSIFLLANKFGYSRADKPSLSDAPISTLKIELGQPAHYNTHPSSASDSDTSDEV